MKKNYFYNANRGPWFSKINTILLKFRCARNASLYFWHNIQFEFKILFSHLLGRKSHFTVTSISSTMTKTWTKFWVWGLEKRGHSASLGLWPRWATAGSRYSNPVAPCRQEKLRHLFTLRLCILFPDWEPWCPRFCLPIWLDIHLSLKS